MANKVGHAKIDEWGSVGISDAGLGERFDSGNKGELFNSAAKHYEEVAADILMKERYGNHLVAEDVREKLSNELKGALVERSFDREGQYQRLGELCVHRAKAEIFGLSDIKAEIDSELKMQHGIDVNSTSDSIAKGINDLTNAYCNLQGLNGDRFKTNFKNIARMSINLDGGGKWLPPDT